MSESSLTMDSDVTGDAVEDNSQLAYQIGEFIVYPQARLLLKNNTEVTIEPKVFDVLSYLCQNASRFVLLKELHDNVWQGRIVSDAAVRRSISKLRNLLGEHSEQPYIKSQHKRGYKLECPVVELSDVNPTIYSDAPIQYRHQSISDKRFSFNSPIAKTSMTLAVLVLMVLAIFHFSTRQANPPQEVIEYPGEKIHVAVDKNGEAIAFAGKIFDFQGYQLFVGNVDDKQVEQITEDANNVVRVAFGPMAQNVYFVDMKLGSSKLIKVALNKASNKHQEPLISNFYIISEIAPSIDGKGIYFCGVAEKGQGSQVFYFDLDTNQVTSVTSEQSVDAHDYSIALSNDGRYLAVATTKGRVKEQKITVFNTDNFSIYKRLLHEEQIFSMNFNSNNDLIVLDSNRLSQFQLSSGMSQALTDHELQGVIAFDLTSENDFIVIREEQQENIYIEMDLPSFSMSSQKLITKANNGITQILFADEHKELLVVRDLGDRRQLAIQITDTSKEKVLLETKMAMQVVDTSYDGVNVLMYIDGLLAVLNTQTSQIDYISNGSEQVYSDAAFAADQQSVFYGVKTNDGWSIQEYNIITKRTELFVQGYRSLRQLENGFLLVDELGNLYIQRLDAEVPQLLNQQLAINVGGQWHVNGDYVYWNEFDGKSIKFHAYHLITHQMTTQQFNKSLIEQQFDVSSDGGKALMIRRNLPETNILQMQATNS